MKAPLYFTALAAGLLSLSAVHAQTQPPIQPVLPKASDGGGKGVDTKKVYDVVEQMPTLPTGGGTQAIVTAVQQALVLPADEKTEGQVKVEFVVDRQGRVQEVKVLQSPSPALGKAVLAAVTKLPQFKPGKQNGETANVRFRLPIFVGPRP